LYVSLNVIRVIKSRRMGWENHKVRIGEMRNAYKIFIEKPEHKSLLGTYLYS